MSGAWSKFWSLIGPQRGRCPYWPCFRRDCDLRHGRGQRGGS